MKKKETEIATTARTVPSPMKKNNRSPARPSRLIKTRQGLTARQARPVTKKLAQRMKKTMKETLMKPVKRMKLICKCNPRKRRAAKKSKTSKRSKRRRWNRSMTKRTKVARQFRMEDST